LANSHGTVEYQNSVLFKAIILSEAEQLPYHCIPLYTIVMFLEHASGVEQLDAKLRINTDISRPCLCAFDVDRTLTGYQESWQMAIEFGLNDVTLWLFNIAMV